jgi:hypothetical protein
MQLTAWDSIRTRRRVLEPDPEQEVDLVLPHPARFACTPIGVANLRLEVEGPHTGIYAHSNLGIDIPLRGLGAEEDRTGCAVTEDSARAFGCDRRAANCGTC